MLSFPDGFQMRQIENQFLAIDPRRLKDIPGRIVDMLGYKVHSPFIGYGTFCRCIERALTTQLMAITL
jgi:hypothetical protein